ncbi:MAG: type II secretion system F family protein [Planctomycetota bacterium JB042]
MNPRAATTPKTSGRRSASSGLDRMSAHREGARLLAQRESAIPALADAEARPGPIRPRDKLFFFAQLSVMIQAGVPIAVALDGITRQCEREKLKTVLQEILEKVEAGQSFSSALMAHPSVFPSAACHLVRAGETSGDLGGMLGRINGLLERDYEMKKKLKGALTYPVVMVLMAIGTVVALFTFILPKFRTLYAGKEDALPATTTALLVTGDFVTAHAVEILGGLGVLVVATVAWLRTPGGRSFLDTFVLAIPVLGTVVRKFSLARSVRTMGALLASGVPVLQALELARDLSSNQRLGEAWEYVRERVAQGGRLQDGMLGQPWFPGTLVQMTAVGESGGILDSVLVKVGEFYDQEAEVSVSEATSLIEPIMVIVVGGVVGFIAMSIMLPIFNMSKLVK